MRYKARISPSFLLCPEIFTWHPIEKCIEKINQSDGCRLNEEASAVDENFSSEIDRVSNTLNAYRTVVFG